MEIKLCIDIVEDFIERICCDTKTTQAWEVLKAKLVPKKRETTGETPPFFSEWRSCPKCNKPVWNGNECECGA